MENRFVPPTALVLQPLNERRVRRNQAAVMVVGDDQKREAIDPGSREVLDDLFRPITGCRTHIVDRHDYGPDSGK
jgi:hypothetical protein